MHKNLQQISLSTTKITTRISVLEFQDAVSVFTCNSTDSCCANVFCKGEKSFKCVYKMLSRWHRIRKFQRAVSPFLPTEECFHFVSHLFILQLFLGHTLNAPHVMVFTLHLSENCPWISFTLGCITPTRTQPPYYTITLVTLHIWQGSPTESNSWAFSSLSNYSTLNPGLTHKWQVFKNLMENAYYGNVT